MTTSTLTVKKKLSIRAVTTLSNAVVKPDFKKSISNNKVKARQTTSVFDVADSKPIAMDETSNKIVETLKKIPPLFVYVKAKDADLNSKLLIKHNECKDIAISPKKDWAEVGKKIVEMSALIAKVQSVLKTNEPVKKQCTDLLKSLNSLKAPILANKKADAAFKILSI